jgi:hypothetical protein
MLSAEIGAPPKAARPLRGRRGPRGGARGCPRTPAARAPPAFAVGRGCAPPSCFAGPPSACVLDRACRHSLPGFFRPYRAGTVAPGAHSQHLFARRPFPCPLPPAPKRARKRNPPCPPTRIFLPDRKRVGGRAGLAYRAPLGRPGRQIRGGSQGRSFGTGAPQNSAHTVPTLLQGNWYVKIPSQHLDC